MFVLQFTNYKFYKFIILYLNMDEEKKVACVNSCDCQCNDTNCGCCEKVEAGEIKDESDDDEEESDDESEDSF